MFPLSVFSSVPNAVQMVLQQKAEAADSRESGWAPLGSRLRRGLGQATGKMECVGVLPPQEGRWRGPLRHVTTK